VLYSKRTLFVVRPDKANQHTDAYTSDIGVADAPGLQRAHPLQAMADSYFSDKLQRLDQ
jgi:hypothetical protein